MEGPPLSCATRPPTTTRTSNDFRRTTVSPKREGWSTAGKPGHPTRIASSQWRHVKSTWVQELSVPGTFYTSVLVRTILDHLEKDGSGLDRPAGVELILSLHKLWEADPRVAQFIINMDEAQKK